MKFHPLSELFPLMQGREFDELVADIKAHGLREPITTLDGMILDGRNRWRACEAAGAEPRTCEYHGEDPLGWVVSLNLHRRHLDESQRAIVAAKIANLGDGQRKSASPIGERAVDPGALDRWVLLDLSLFRREFIREGLRVALGKPPRLGRIAQAQHNGDGTHFVAFDVRRFPRETVIACSHDVPALEAA